MISTKGRWSVGSNGLISVRSIAAPAMAEITMATAMANQMPQCCWVTNIHTR